MCFTVCKSTCNSAGVCAVKSRDSRGACFAARGQQGCHDLTERTRQHMLVCLQILCLRCGAGCTVTAGVRLATRLQRRPFSALAMSAPAHSPRARQGVENHRISRMARDAGRSVMHFSPLTPHRTLAEVQQRRQASPRPSPARSLYDSLSSDALNRSAFSLNESFALNESQRSSRGGRAQIPEKLRASQTAAAIAAAKGYTDGDTVQVAPSFDYKHAKRANMMKVPPPQRAGTITQTNQRQAREIARYVAATGSETLSLAAAEHDYTPPRSFESKQEPECLSCAEYGRQKQLSTWPRLACQQTLSCCARTTKTVSCSQARGRRHKAPWACPQAPNVALPPAPRAPAPTPAPPPWASG